jgi:excisionase family DNA binding protein
MEAVMQIFFLKVEKVAFILRLNSVRTVRRLIDRKELAAVKAGKEWRVPVEALVKLLGNEPLSQEYLLKVIAHVAAQSPPT